MMSLSDIKVIFKGTKSFWKTKNYLEIVMVEHKLLGVIEIIAYDPCIETESDRLYLRTSDLVAEIKSDELIEKITPLLKLGKDGQLLVVDLIHKAKSSYLFNHLFISEYLPESKLLKIEISNRFSEEITMNYKKEQHLLKCSRPVSLVPYAVSFNQKGNLDHAVAMLDRKISRSNVMLPGLCLKISRGLPLSRTETAIWDEFHKRHSDEEVMTLIATMLAELMPTHAELLNSAIHTVSLPIQTPFPPSRSLSCSVSVSNLKVPTSIKTEDTCTDSSNINIATPLTETPSTTNIIGKDKLKKTSSMFIRSLSMVSLQRDLRRCFSDIFTPSSKKVLSNKTHEKKLRPKRIRKVSVRKIQCSTPRSNLSIMTASTCSSTEQSSYTATTTAATVDMAVNMEVCWKPAVCSTLHSKGRRIQSCPPSPRNGKQYQ